LAIDGKQQFFDVELQIFDVEEIEWWRLQMHTLSDGL
jgi:hypothetical protein